jgi:hypothetical protein
VDEGIPTVFDRNNITGDMPVQFFEKSFSVAVSILIPGPMVVEMAIAFK